MVVDVALLHPAVGEAVDEGTHQAVAQVVLRLSCHTGKVADGNLGDTSLLKEHEGGQEAVHAVEEGDAACAGGVQHLERAAGVLCRVARHHATEAVGYLRLETLAPGVLACCTDAGDQLVAVGLGKQEVEVLGRGLQVGVDVADEG